MERPERKGILRMLRQMMGLDHAAWKSADTQNGGL